MSWDWLVSFGIIGALILAFWSKMSGQTIPELITGIKEALIDKGEETVNMGIDIYE